MPAPDLDRFTSRRSTVYGSRGVVATSQPLAAEAGVELLRQGGNAFDAAVAAAAASNVVEPTSTGVGGDVFALYRTAGGDTGALCSCGGAPAAATISAVREALGENEENDGDVEMPFRGPHTVTVPGTARGWETTVEELGRLTLAACLAPAVRYATEGYPVSEVVAAQWEHGEEVFEDENARDAYLFDGHAPRVGQRVRLPALGRTLERIGDEGADVVYEGDIADEIVDAVQSRGGFLSTDDLADFEPEFVDPISTTYGGCAVYELPPNNQGLVALEALNIATEVGVQEATGVDRVHLLAEATKRAFHDGHRYITDPDFAEMPPLNSREWAQKRAAGIGSQASTDVEFRPRTHAEDADTVLVCVADREGNVVSYINSRFAGFGSGLVAGDTGIALQNRGASFSLDASHPNRLDGGKKPFHTLIPGLVDFAPDERAADDWAAFGVMGGFMQPQGHVQVVSNLVDREFPLQRALDEPRWRYREDGTLAVEERLEDKTKLARRGHDVRVLPPSMFGGAQLARTCDGVLSGGTEPRKDGSVATY